MVVVNLKVVNLEVVNLGYWNGEFKVWRYVRLDLDSGISADY